MQERRGKEERRMAKRVVFFRNQQRKIVVSRKVRMRVTVVAVAVAVAAELVLRDK